MKQILKEDYDFFADSLTRPSPVSIRLNPFKPSRLFLKNERVPWLHSGRYLDERPSFTFDPFFHAGAYYVQEASSMFIGEMVRQLQLENMPLTVLDLCAAPGGKSTLLNAVLPEHSLIVANEAVGKRVKILEENLLKWGTPDFVICSSDTAKFKPLNGFFDIVLVDAPCSGEGMFRKEAHAIKQWSPSLVKQCALRQHNILSDAITLLKPGGYLIYSTCTFAPEENEANMKWLLEQNLFESVPVALASDWNIFEKMQVVNGQKAYSYHFYPHKVKGEGFFASCLRNINDKNYTYSSSKPSLQYAGKQDTAVVSQWLKRPEDYVFIVEKGEIIAIHKQHAQNLEALKASLYIRSAGIKIGSIIKNELKPAHHLAVSTILSDNIPAVELTYEQAIEYLKLHPPGIHTPAQTGWALAKYRGFNLGWIKILPNRINNYYPREYKIRKG